MNQPPRYIKARLFAPHLPDAGQVEFLRTMPDGEPMAWLMKPVPSEGAYAFFDLTGFNSSEFLYEFTEVMEFGERDFETVAEIAAELAVAEDTDLEDWDQ